NLIPFIDVLLVILIFLMITTTYSKFTALQITLPTADAEKAVERPHEVNVIVDAQGRYAINNVQVPFRDVNGLTEALRQAAGPATPGRSTVVIINADALAAHQSVINVLEAARMAGLAQVSFAAQASKK
ncbi:MAG: biopolymer transporter ExbD, partial [Paucimonas sp.]|nr:biopolymer transporter ExbD [Paucimonas sp.]